jgi:predicted lipoprotein with Yx(FWY)xxD motif
MKVRPSIRPATRRRNPLLLAAAAAVASLALAACGGNSSNGGTTANSMASSAETVSAKSIGGAGNVLVDSQGAALYTNDMDTASKVACTGACTAIWVPLAAPSGGQPSSADSSIESKLGTIDRPDGTTQVTFGGRPLYSFVQDQPGQVTGNGVGDSFGGTSFTWTVATAGGASSTSAGTTSTGSSGGRYGGGGGYGGY